MYFYKIIVFCIVLRRICENPQGLIQKIKYDLTLQRDVGLFYFNILSTVIGMNQTHYVIETI